MKNNLWIVWAIVETQKPNNQVIDISIEVKLHVGTKEEAIGTLYAHIHAQHPNAKIHVSAKRVTCINLLTVIEDVGFEGMEWKAILEMHKEQTQ